MEFVVLVAVWLLLSVLAGKIADRKGRSGGSYFLLSLLLSPAVGLLAAAIATPDRAAAEGQRISSGDERKCPFCAELVKREATVCRFCSKDLPPPEARPGIPRFKSKKEYDAWKARQSVGKGSAGGSDASAIPATLDHHGMVRSDDGSHGEEIRPRFGRSSPR